MGNLEILYEDNHIIVCYKPQGVLSQADGSNMSDMLTLIKEYLVEKYHKPGAAYLGLVHRLDTNTSGVMVFAKTSKAAARLFEVIKNNEMHKKYLAAVCKSLPIDGKIIELVDYLIKDEDTNISRVTTNENGKKACLTYEVVANNSNISILSVNLITGRHHQIRVQLASRGLPIYGDIKYGGVKNDNFCLGLQAYSLRFLHPTTKESMTFEKINSEGIFSILKK